MTLQSEHTSMNKTAWNQGPYQAWLSRFGTPQEAAVKISKDPAARLSTLYPLFEGVSGKRIANLLGSHGSKAVALALLGADVTVVDIAEENAAYALTLAAETGVTIRYVVSDVLRLPEEELVPVYDVVLMEFGILHYFTDLTPLLNVIIQLLKPGGRLLLQDFHPITTKLISSKGTRHTIRKHRVDGDYFDTSIEEVEVPYAKFLSDEQRVLLSPIHQRRWTLGEIVTAVADSGLFIRKLIEEPNLSSDVFDKGIPKSFTVVALKME